MVFEGEHPYHCAMANIIKIVFGVVIAGFVLAAVLSLLWWLLILAAVVAVAGFVWRAVTQSR